MKIQAVKTTGIYCRPECGAKPKRENVRTMKNSLAALAAGFRPCLVCRPDRLPDYGLDQPAPEIAQAVRLIAEGFPDSEIANGGLAKRVGVGSTQLTALFEKHFGATPDFVAKARKTHLARRLLDETQLSITKVAVAAGFSNVRQMNRVVKDLFAFSPAEFRAKRKSKFIIDSNGDLNLRIPFSQPYHGNRLIDYLAARAIPGVESVVHGIYKRTINACDGAGVVEVSAPENEDHLVVKMHLAKFGAIIDEVESVRSLFGLNNQNSAAVKYLRKDKLLGKVIRKNTGLRLPGAFDRFETAIRIVVGQQISVAGASTVTGRLAARFGQRIEPQHFVSPPVQSSRAELPVPDSLQFLFPTASVIASADVSDLSMPKARANTIKCFAAAVVSGEIDLTSTAPLKETTDALESLPGIGPWTSHLIAGRVMRHQDAFPASDLGLRKSAAKLLGKSDPISAIELEKIAEAWRPFRATAAAYLWMN